MFIEIGFTGYVFKLCIAVLLTRVIYIVHGIIDRYLGIKESHDLVKHTAENSLNHKVDE